MTCRLTQSGEQILEEEDGVVINIEGIASWISADKGGKTGKRTSRRTPEGGEIDAYDAAHPFWPIVERISLGPGTF